uniref:Uncharacterized protein n=1 Tax=Anguilla anguilla TaxID=7936 RepID=A0A0E9P554_ANGAN
MLRGCSASTDPWALVKNNSIMNSTLVPGHFSQKPGCLCQQTESH